MSFTPNEQQIAVFNWPKVYSKSLNLIARAGCGKSTTAVELTKYLTGQVFLGAFNKAIAVELQQKVGNRPGVVVGTMHSLGLYHWKRIRSKSKIESRKVHNLVRPYFPQREPSQKACASIVRDAVSYAKQSGFGLKGIDYTDSKQWMDLADHYDLWDELPKLAVMTDGEGTLGGKMKGDLIPVTKEVLVKVCIEVYDESLEQCISETDSIIDFDDMILAPLYFSDFKASQYDWVLIDEAQDTSETRRRLAQWVLKPNGRMVAIGDPAQAIYGFAGATNDAMDLIKKEMHSIELPLSVTYRCPKKVVALAQTWVPDITAHESAPEGEVTEINHREFLRTDFKSTDVILCRNTRPLIGIAGVLRKRGIECVVEGVNYQGLIGLVSKWGEEIPIGRMLDSLSEYTQGEVNRLVEEGKEEKAEQANEKCQMIWDFSDGLKVTEPVYKLLDKIDRLLNFSADDREVLRLCTVHRSKGREWDRVFLVGRNLYMPSKWAKQDWELQQEQNLMYVAVTRSKRALVEVNVPVKPRKDGGPWWEE